MAGLLRGINSIKCINRQFLHTSLQTDLLGGFGWRVGVRCKGSSSSKYIAEYSQPTQHKLQQVQQKMTKPQHHIQKKSAQQQPKQHTQNQQQQNQQPKQQTQQQLQQNKQQQQQQKQQLNQQKQQQQQLNQQKQQPKQQAQQQQKQQQQNQQPKQQTQQQNQQQNQQPNQQKQQQNQQKQQQHNQQKQQQQQNKPKNIKVDLMKVTSKKGVLQIKHKATLLKQNMLSSVVGEHLQARLAAPNNSIAARKIKKTGFDYLNINSELLQKKLRDPQTNANSSSSSSNKKSSTVSGAVSSTMISKKRSSERKKGSQELMHLINKSIQRADAKRPSVETHISDQQNTFTNMVTPTTTQFNNNLGGINNNLKAFYEGLNKKKPDVRINEYNFHNNNNNNISSVSDFSNVNKTDIINNSPNELLVSENPSSHDANSSSVKFTISKSNNILNTGTDDGGGGGSVYGGDIVHRPRDTIPLSVVNNIIYSEPDGGQGNDPLVNNINTSAAEAVNEESLLNGAMTPGYYNITMDEIAKTYYRDKKKAKATKEEKIAYDETHHKNAKSKTEKKSKVSAKKEKAAALRAKNLANIRQFREARKRKKFHEELDAFLSVCVSNGMVNMAYNTLADYYYKHNVPSPSLISYNIVMQSNLNAGQLFRVMAIMSWLRKDEKLWLKKEERVCPDATSYALSIAALHQLGVSAMEARDRYDAGRLSGQQYYCPSESIQYTECAMASERFSNVDKTNNYVSEKIEDLLLDMETQGLTKDDLFLSTGLPIRSYNDALAGVHRVCYQYQRTLQETTSFPNYDCHLLDQLNTQQKYDRGNPEAAGLMKTSGSPYVVSKAAVEEQLNMEIRGKVLIESVHPFPQDELQSYTLKKCEDHWRDCLNTALSRELKNLRDNFFESKTSYPICLYPYLSLFSVDQLADIMVQELPGIINSTENRNNSCYRLHFNLGNHLFGLYTCRYKKEKEAFDKLNLVYGKYCEIYANHAATGNFNGRVLIEQLAQEYPQGARLDCKPPPWSYETRMLLGSYLYIFMIKNINVWSPMHPDDFDDKPDVYPALHEVESNYGYNNILEIMPHPFLSKMYDQKSNLSFCPTCLPMLCPPMPWVNPGTGALLHLPSPMIRLPPNSCPSILKRVLDCSNQQLYPVFDSVNALSYTPWVIYKEMLDTLITVFKTNSGTDLDIPQHPSFCQQPEPLPSTPTEKDRKEHWAATLQYKKLKNEMNSLWCTSLHKISIANQYRDTVFWLPHNLDFRGRAYPCSPHLSPVNSDVFRSILQFAEPKPLGAKGLEWLKIHTINLTGFKKQSSLADRLQHCEDLLPEIIDSADNPLTGRRWWTTSDEPWQTLGACKELRNALASPRPQEYMSRLPIHQDGSCNGLQHYAALGRDLEGAIGVNLAPNDTPQDVYTRVASLVEKKRAKDARNPKSQHHAIAKVLEGHIKRKVIKQTVMTTVYGVTKFGAWQQIEKQLKELTDLCYPELSLGARYLSLVTFNSIGAMFSTTKEIQDWFSDCANSITKKCGKTVEWVTPLGLRVVQPYNKTVSTKKILELSKTFPITNFSDLQMPDTRKQKNAFPPNYIHSLDACHLMLTALHSVDYTFASVHDCYWTHACSVDTMNEVCRKQFVALHCQPLLQQLSESFLQLYNVPSKSCLSNEDASSKALLKLQNTRLKVYKTFTDVPQLGQFDIEQVKKSTFFFS